MKDSAVDTAGLFDIRRQRQLLQGMEGRFRGSIEKHDALQLVHGQQRSAEEAQLAHERAAVANQCRVQRREMLRRWDQAEEETIRRYETDVVALQADLQAVNANFRRIEKDEKQTIERKVTARHQAVLHQYDSHKNEPVEQRQKEYKRIDSAIDPVLQMVQQARELALRRLDHVPDVEPAEADEGRPQHEPPATIEEAIDRIRGLSSQCQSVFSQMQSTAASRVIDSHALLVVAVLIAVAWAIGAFFATGGSVLWMSAGIVPAGLLGLGLYLGLMIPLKRTTRRLYPEVERIGHAAQQCADAGKRISTQTANETAAELAALRDEHLDATKRWMNEQLTSLQQRVESEQKTEKRRLAESRDTVEKSYVDSYVQVGTDMRTKADAVADQIVQQLATIDQALQRRREASAAKRHGQLAHLSNRLRKGIRDGLDRLQQTELRVQERFPDWSTVLASPAPNVDSIDFLPLGWLRIQQALKSSLRPDDSSAQRTGNGSADRHSLAQVINDAELPSRLPVVLHRRLYSAVVVRCGPQHIDRAIDLVHQLLWRLLTGAPPGRAKLTLIDPLGRGQNFTSFMALADHDPAIVGHRVWTTDSKVDERLGELAHHVEDVLQASLRDRFERIEDYNQVAGSMAEPYRAVAAVGFPEGLTQQGYRHLSALIESGLRCGIFTALVCDKFKPWPNQMPIPSGEKVLELEIDDSGQWHLIEPGLDALPFDPAPSPPGTIRDQLVARIGSDAVAAARVEIPLHNVLSAADEGKGCSDDGLSIVIGSQGGSRLLSLKLGEGVRQHVLIAGKTGSGKSTLLHSIISSGAHYYRPDQLQFFLLDFKKGVEFKPYAEIGLPHARVIGIESEREFGHSVLQRLDTELHQRGELFRAAGAQDLREYRSKTGNSMPRIMLVIDEFQELFVRDDRLAADCTMLLDRLVRQGRSFGMHVVLSSQSLAGAYSLPRATLGQMAVRIAMQCSESDASLILSDDNTAARLISRPGEAIYNDASGLVEGNQPFQVAWLSSRRHREMLRAITARDGAYRTHLDPPVVFEGNRPCRWSPLLADGAIASRGTTTLRGLLGESVEIGPPLALEFTRDTGRNALVMAALPARRSLLGSIVAGLAKCDRALQVVYFDGARGDDGDSVGPWIVDTGVSVRMVKPRECQQAMAELAELVRLRGERDREEPPVVVVVDPLERFREFRQDESFNFSLDAAAGDPNASANLQSVLRDGPANGVHLIVVCGSAETLSRWLPRASQHDLELRILGQMNPSDSALLIDSPAAADLTTATLLLYDDSDGRITKFRQCELPAAKEVKTWLG